MNILIHIYYSGENGNARAFAQEMLREGVVDAIRAEEGNLQYDYFYPAEDPQTVLLVDKWSSQKALDQHHHSPQMQKILMLREKYDLHMRVERYVSDEAGVPQGDRRFIRE